MSSDNPNSNTAPESHLIPVGVKYNSQGKIYMICFVYFTTHSRLCTGYIDVPSYKVEEYLSPVHNEHQADVKYVKGKGIVFPACKIYELDALGNFIKESTTDCIPEILFATKAETGITSVKFAPKSLSDEPLIMSLRDRLNDSNLILEHNVRYTTATDAASACKAITVRNTASDPRICRLFLASAPNLQAIQMQGCGLVAVDSAPSLKQIMLDLSHVWSPANSLPDSDYMYPNGGVAVKGLARCFVKTEYISGVPDDVRAGLSRYRFGYTLDFSCSNNLRILIEDYTPVLALRTCSNVTIHVAKGVSIGHLVLQNCTNVTISGTASINQSTIQKCDNVKISAGYIDSITVNNSRLAIRSNINFVSLAGGTKLALDTSSHVSKCSLDNRATVIPGKGTTFQAIHYITTPKKPLLPANLYLLDDKRTQYGGEHNGVVTIVVNKPFNSDRTAGRLGLTTSYQLPHILYIAPDVPVKATLEQLFDNKQLFLTVDNSFQANPYIYVVCTPNSQKEVLDYIGKAFAEKNFAGKIKFMPADKFATGREWLKSEGITLPSNYPEF